MDDESEFGEPTQSVRRTDIEADLAAIQDRLGEPEALYRTNPSSVAFRFILGVVIVLGVATLHYLVWTGNVPWPAWRHFKLIVLMLLGMFIAPGVGLYLIGFAVRGRRMWVLQYPTGLFVWHRGEVVAMPWDEIIAIGLRGLPEKGKIERSAGPDGQVGETWFELARSGKRLFGTRIELLRRDGAMAEVSSILVNFADLGTTIQRETFRRLLPVALAEAATEEGVDFGDFSCTTRGIRWGKHALDWGQVTDVVKVADKIEVRKTGSKKPWAKFDPDTLMNLHVFMGLASIFVRPGEAPSEADE